MCHTLEGAFVRHLVSPPATPSGLCARRTVIISTGTMGPVVLGVFWPASPLWQTAVFLSSRSAPFNFVLVYIRRSKNTIPCDPFF
jgi:hypothetical protein